jgi:hypothetical protein
LEVGPKR